MLIAAQLMLLLQCAVILLVAWPFWVGLAICAFALVLMRKMGPDLRSTTSQRIVWLLPFLAPILIVVFSLWQSGALEKSPGLHWQHGVMVILVVGELVAAAALVMRSIEMSLGLLVALLGLWITAASCFLGGMALSNDWL